MAKKIVRGITDIKNIEHQDLDTNNVNDLLSDGEHSYIHRKKKDGSEEYHNLTNNLKTIQSDDTDLLTVTNYNNTTNSATIRPKHDSQKEQVLESTDNTIEITHGENGTDETTNLDVNPAKVLEHDNLVSDSQYVTIEHEEGSQTSVIKTEKLDNDLNDLSTKIDSVEAKIPTVAGSRNYVLGTGTAKTTTASTSTELYDLTSAFDDVPDNSTLIIEFDWSVTAPTSTSKFRINRLITYSDGTADQWHNMIIKDGTSSDVSTSSGAGHYSGLFPKVPYTGTEVSSRSINLNQTATSGTVTISNLTIRIGSLKSDWEPAPEDYDSKLAQKQNTLTSNSSIGVSGTGLMQLYSYQMSYTVTSAVTEGSLNTYAKTVKKDTNLTADPKLEYHFTAELKAGKTSITVPLNNNDTTYFSYILIKYGETSGSTQTAMINGLVFSLSGSNLTISRDSSTYNQVVSFSDIIDPSQDTTQ